MLSSNEILAVIEGGGFRSTASRRRLAEVLTSYEEGFTAEELVAEALGVGRATVYRTIRLLVEQELLCKLSLPDGTPRYTLAQRGHHHHVVCQNCGSVREFRQSTMERMLKELESLDGDVVTGHRVEIFVVCAECLARGVIPANVHHH
jgi:Fur family ferric uptake transcriptional regulator